MNGAAGNDVLNGRNGNDVITGGAGNDTINGGTATDTAVFAGASSNFTMSSNGTTITVTDNTGAEGVDAVTAVETLRFNGVNHAVLTGTALANTLNGGATSDAIFALAGNDTINGLAGNDLIYANGGADQITQASATGGRDFVDGGADEDTFTVTTDIATAEAFVIYTRAAALSADPTLTLNANTEIVITRNGSVMSELDNIEEIIISTLRVTSPGGAAGGNVAGDSISVVGDFNQTSLNFNTITIDGNAGNDTVDISALESAHRIVFTSNGGQDTIIGDLRPQDIVNMDEVTEPTTPDAPAGDMLLQGTKGSDDLVGDEGHDRILGAQGNDRLVGMEGNDRISGASGHDRMAGMDGDDRMRGGSGNDHLDGGAGVDRLEGGMGSDYLDGGEGADRLRGGAGEDTFVFGDGDQVDDFISGEDLIELYADANNIGSPISISRDGSDLLINIGDQSMSLKDVETVSIDDFNLGGDEALATALGEALAAFEGGSAAAAEEDNTASDSDLGGQMTEPMIVSPIAPLDPELMATAM
jgi:Ca2+-binding RTX toxin-like protein